MVATITVTGRKLDLGNGGKSEEGWVTFDVSRALRPMAQGDAHLLPFKDNSFQGIRCWHVLEHVPPVRYVFHPEQKGAMVIPAWIESRYGVVDVLNECWRVLEPGGVIDIEVPLFPTEDAIADPTHVGLFVSSTFDYFTGDDGHEEHRQLYGIKPWKLLHKERVNYAKEIIVEMQVVK